MEVMKVMKVKKFMQKSLVEWGCIPVWVLSLAGALFVTGWMGYGVAAADEAKATSSSAAGVAAKQTQVKYEFLTDLEKSKVIWSGTKLVGGGHEGDLKVKSGYIVFAEGKPVAAEVVMDMNTINCTDLKAGSKSKQKLEAHLKNEDFFAVTQYPTATLKATSFKLYQGSVYAVDGELTIRGVTQPIGFTVELTKSATTTKGTGSFEFDRVEFNVKYNSSKLFKTLGDKAINDIVRLSFNFEAGAS